MLLVVEQFKLFIVDHMSNSTHQWRAHLWWNIHYWKLYLRTPCVQTILASNNQKDVVLQIGALEYSWSIHDGSDVRFIHGSWPYGTKSNFFSSSGAWLSHWPYIVTNHTYILYWWILIWWFASKTANLPNLFPRQYIWLCGRSYSPIIHRQQRKTSHFTFDTFIGHSTIQF